VNETRTKIKPLGIGGLMSEVPSSQEPTVRLGVDSWLLSGPFRTGLAALVCSAPGPLLRGWK